MVALVMRNTHMDTAADLGLGQSMPHMTLGDRSAYSGSSVPAKVTAARQSSTAVTIVGSMDAVICSVRASIGNKSVGGLRGFDVEEVDEERMRVRARRSFYVLGPSHLQR
jgi:hypothetical protein